MSQSANLLVFPIESSIFVILAWETMCVSKAQGWPQDRQMPDSWVMQNLLMPTPGTGKVGKCPTVTLGGGGWAQLELTDALG